MPIVVAVILLGRIDIVRNFVVGGWWRLITLGDKGAGVKFGRGITLTPGSHVTIGEKVFIGDGAILEVGVEPSARLLIGAHSWLSHDCHILCRQFVAIGSHVLIGEFVSIRDSTHNFSHATVPIKLQGDKIGSIEIGDDSWIGRGCLIQGTQDGLKIGKGAVIAANSVVTRSIPDYEIWGGVPAKFIRHRAAASREGERRESQATFDYDIADLS